MPYDRRMAAEYNELIARAFNGAVVVDGQRVAAHPSGTLLTRIAYHDLERRRVAWQRLNALGPGVLDNDNDWSDV
jgi:hypothetical protein